MKSRNTTNDAYKKLNLPVANFICLLEDDVCLSKATEKFKTIPTSYFHNPINTTSMLVVFLHCIIDSSLTFSVFHLISRLSSSTRASVYKYHVLNTNSFEDWSLLKTLYNRTLDLQEKDEILVALATIRAPCILNLYLEELMMEQSLFRDHEFFPALVEVSKNPVGRHIVWDFYRSNWNQLVNR
jgi:hypothetical protein